MCLCPSLYLLLVCCEVFFASIQPQYTRHSWRFLEREDGLIYGGSSALRDGRDVGRKEGLAFDGTFRTATVSSFQIEGGVVRDAVVVKKDRIFVFAKHAKYGSPDQLALAQLQEDSVRIIYRKCPELWRLDLQSQTNEKISIGPMQRITKSKLIKIVINENRCEKLPISAAALSVLQARTGAIISCAISEPYYTVYNIIRCTRDHGPLVHLSARLSYSTDTVWL